MSVLMTLHCPYCNCFSTPYIDELDEHAMDCPFREIARLADENAAEYAARNRPLPLELITYLGVR